MDSMMMQMYFYWGKTVTLLFSGFPGDKLGLYILALILVFLAAVIVEWLSSAKLYTSGPNYVGTAFLQTFIHGLRVALAFLIMLCVMSFNVGVFIAAVLGHTIGFLIFGTSLFR
ncbi:Copper transporter [Thalictrum thalictroides]|uniref:Copper transport protein n=1 Tax=Thalictrum thalictroides TaxID=46969 RepID=A0A7J6W8R8_THATH|nr:Copper transporter [Thalictrum thalictroides]